MRCRCRTLAEASTPAFVLPGDGRVWPRDRPFRVVDLTARIDLDLENEALAATAEIVVERVAPDATAVCLDAVDFDLHEVSVDGHRAAHHYDGQRLHIELGRAHRAALRIAYSVRPQRGLYFRRRSSPEGRPEGPVEQVWSQGQDEDNRCWLPLIDHPGERHTSALIVSAPSAWTVVSNGALLGRVERGDRAEWSYRQSQPHAPYLIALAAGVFVTTRSEAAGVPIEWHVPPDGAPHLQRSLGRTGPMVEFFAERFGHPFPWSKYAQVVVRDFIFGGMENTSATLLTEHVLLDERAALDVDMESLVAHELAHQWFGDYVTCRDWSHGWLNEGFATYAEHLWREHRFGHDAMLYGLEQDRDTYFAEAADRYERPIVTNTYAQPIDLFDRHLYEKGGLVLHALRETLGDGPFFAGIARYLATHGGQVAETRDLVRAMEHATGRSLEAFFDRHVHTQGHVELEATAEWRGGVLRVGLHTTRNPSDSPIEVPVAVTSDGQTTLHRLLVDRPHASWTLPLSKAPSLVLIDPRSQVLGSIDLQLGLQLLIAQLRAAPTAQPRWRAARALAHKYERRAVDALVASLREDGAWMVRAEAAAALGTQRTPSALAALLATSRVERDPHVRRAIAQALGAYSSSPGDTAAADRLIEWIHAGDPSIRVESELRRALGRTRDDRALAILAEDARHAEPAWADLIRQGAFGGLGSLRTPAAVASLIETVTPGRPDAALRVGVEALGRTAEATSDTEKLLDARDALVRVAASSFDPGVRSRVARALAKLRLPETQTALQRLAGDPDGRVRRAAREALRSVPANPAGGHREVEALERELRALRERVDALEAHARHASSAPPFPSRGGDPHRE